MQTMLSLDNEGNHRFLVSSPSSMLCSLSFERGSCTCTGMSKRNNTPVTGHVGEVISDFIARVLRLCVWGRGAMRDAPWAAERK